MYTNITLSDVHTRTQHHTSFTEIDLPLCPRPVVIMGLSDRPAMIAQGKWDRGGSRRMMEESFLSPMERSVILTEEEKEVRIGLDR